MIKTISTTLLLLSFLAISLGCSSKSAEDEEDYELDADASDNQANVEDDGEDSDEDDEAAAEEVADATHPDKNDSWSTTTLLQTTKLPTVGRLRECRAELLALAKDRGNESGLHEIVESLEPDVDSESDFYHWCFYWSFQALENKLKKPGLGIQEKGTYFYRHLVPLWALGKALDEVAEEPKYLKYVRARYMQLSYDIFGRRLQPLFPSSKGSKRSSGKPAGRADVD